MTDELVPLLKIMQLTAASDDDDDSSSEQGVVELPEHLIYSIFLKLPNKTLIRFLSLSKHWNETFTSRRFSMDQKKTSPELLVAAILYIRHDFEKKSGQYYAQKLYGSHCQPDLQDMELSCPVQNYDNFCPEYMDFMPNDRWLGFISCDGLVGMIHLKGDSLLYDWYSIVIWNPYTGCHEDVLVPQPLCYACKSESGDYRVRNSFKGFGYDVTVNDYKIVVIDMIDYSSYASRVMIRGLNKVEAVEGNTL
ncbi:hypothetical protein QQ045_031507 [Rhodiola kirilowii]